MTVDNWEKRSLQGSRCLVQADPVFSLAVARNVVQDRRCEQRVVHTGPDKLDLRHRKFWKAVVLQEDEIQFSVVLCQASKHKIC